MGNRALVEPGDVLVAALPEQVPGGHEQEGTRPVVVVGVPPEPARDPVVIVVPLTAHEGPWADANPVTYPRLGVGAGGLTAKSTVLLDQVRSLDAQRVQEYLGTLSTGDLSRIRSGLRHILSL